MLDEFGKAGVHVRTLQIDGDTGTRRRPPHVLDPPCTLLAEPDDRQDRVARSVESGRDRVPRHGAHVRAGSEDLDLDEAEPPRTRFPPPELVSRVCRPRGASGQLPPPVPGPSAHDTAMAERFSPPPLNRRRAACAGREERCSGPSRWCGRLLCRRGGTVRPASRDVAGLGAAERQRADGPGGSLGPVAELDPQLAQLVPYTVGEGARREPARSLCERPLGRRICRTRALGTVIRARLSVIRSPCHGPSVHGGRFTENGPRYEPRGVRPSPRLACRLPAAGRADRWPRAQRTVHTRAARADCTRVTRPPGSLSWARGGDDEQTSGRC